MAEPEEQQRAEQWPDEQPIQRIVGTRRRPPSGALPSAQTRALLSANARYLTRAPKGVFIYRSHEEMNRDRDRWTVEAILARQLKHG